MYSKSECCNKFNNAHQPRESVHPSIRPSVHPSIRPSVHPYQYLYLLIILSILYLHLYLRILIQYIESERERERDWKIIRALNDFTKALFRTGRIALRHGDAEPGDLLGLLP